MKNIISEQIPIVLRVVRIYWLERRVVILRVVGEVAIAASDNVVDLDVDVITEAAVTMDTAVMVNIPLR